MSIWVSAINLLISIILAIVAIYGIDSWQRQLKWKKQYELTETVLTIVYQVQDAIISIRSPFSFSDEGTTRIKSPSESKEESSNLDHAYIVFERYEKYKELFSKLRSTKYRFMAIFGKEYSVLFDEFERILGDIFYAARILGDTYWQNQGHKSWANNTEFKQHLKEMHEFEEIIWSRSENDKIQIKVSDIVQKIENVCNYKKSMR